MLRRVSSTLTHMFSFLSLHTFSKHSFITYAHIAISKNRPHAHKSICHCRAVGLYIFCFHGFFLKLGTSFFAFSSTFVITLSRSCWGISFKLPHMVHNPLMGIDQACDVSSGILSNNLISWVLKLTQPRTQCSSLPLHRGNIHCKVSPNENSTSNSNCKICKRCVTAMSIANYSLLWQYVLL